MSDPVDNLETYLVGGAVRDRLLGIENADRDWVVVGSTPERMIELGFRPVGGDFPVFLHPRSNEEYALARSERKTARGYHGFDIISDPGVTLEQDLMRRDLTVNAMAMDRDGRVVDPYGGRDDLDARVLRHVSPAFVEDPVRVLRVARFAARFDDRGFRVDPGTRDLMSTMVENGEVDALQPERVWQELHGALCGPRSARFIRELRECGALERLLPEVHALFGVPQPPQYHPEVDTGVHLLMSLDAAHIVSDDPRVRFAVLLHDLGKGITPVDQLPSHRGHETAGLPLVEQVCARLRVPGRYRKLALRVCEYHLLHHRVGELRPATVLRLLEGLDAFRQPENVPLFSASCEADLRGRLGRENEAYPQAERLAEYFDAARSVDAGAIAREHQGGAAIAAALASERQRRISEIKEARAAGD